MRSREEKWFHCQGCWMLWQVGWTGEGKILLLWINGCMHSRENLQDHQLGKFTRAKGAQNDICWMCWGKQRLMQRAEPNLILKKVSIYSYRQGSCYAHSKNVWSPESCQICQQDERLKVGNLYFLNLVFNQFGAASLIFTLFRFLVCILIKLLYLEKLPCTTQC